MNLLPLKSLNERLISSISYKLQKKSKNFVLEAKPSGVKNLKGVHQGHHSRVRCYKTLRANRESKIDTIQEIEK